MHPPQMSGLPRWARRDRSTALLPSAVACAWALVFAGVHVYWLTGGTAGLPGGMTVLENTPLLVIDVIAIPLCLAAAGLALALTRTWSPPYRRIVVGLAAATSALLVVHAVPAVPDWITLVAGHASAGGLDPMARFSTLLYEPFFMAGGVLFGLATYHRCSRRRSRRPDAHRP